MRFSATIIMLAAAFFGGCDTEKDTIAVRTIEASRFRVVRVIDGDTYVIHYDGDDTSVRVPGINAPERGTPGADAATDALIKLISDRTVRIEFHGPRKRDNFGRLLATTYITLPDGSETTIAAEMLRLGLAEKFNP